MPINALITDPATGRTAELSTENHLITSLSSCPPLLPQKCRIFRQFLTDDGTATGSEDMRVVGSLAAPLQFWIPADNDVDRYITMLSFVIADDGAKLNLFGAIAALTNGCRLFYSYDLGDAVISDNLVTNWEFVRTAQGNPSFGTGGDVFKGKDIEGKVDAYIPVINFMLYMPPYGVKLDRGTNDRMVLEVRDNVSAIDSFNCIASGFERWE